MKAIPQFYFQDVSSHVIHKTVDHKRPVIKVSELKKLLKDMDESMYVDLNDRTYGMGMQGSVTVNFLKKMKYTDQEYANLMAERNLQSKLSINEKTLGVLKNLRQPLANGVGMHEFQVAKKKLDELQANDRIPPAKKKELVERATAKVRELEMKVNCEAPEMLAEINAKMAELQSTIDLQRDILNIQTDLPPVKGDYADEDDWDEETAWPNDRDE